MEQPAHKFELAEIPDPYELQPIDQAAEFANGIGRNWGKRARPNTARLRCNYFEYFDIEEVVARKVGTDGIMGPEQPAVLARHKSSQYTFIVVRENDDEPRFGVYAYNPYKSRQDVGDERFEKVEVPDPNGFHGATLFAKVREIVPAKPAE